MNQYKLLAHGGSHEEVGYTNKVVDAFSHWPPTAHDAHYYLEGIFLLTFLILAAIQIARRYAKK